MKLRIKVAAVVVALLATVGVATATTVDDGGLIQASPASPTGNWWH